MNIQGIWLKIKGFADEGVGEWGLFALILLVALGSFGLGRLSVIYEGKPLIGVSQASAAATAPIMAFGGQFVASRTGAVYYYPWCSGATKIKPENQRWFASEEAAQKAGFRPAKNCKGLTE